MTAGAGKVRVQRGKREDLDVAAVDFAVAELSAAVARSGRAFLGLPGGRSITGILEGMKMARLPWESVHIFLADERRVPIDSIDSNYREISELMLVPTPHGQALPKDHLHPCASDAAAYSAQFSRIASRFDLLLLGVGEDGHVASLFPGHPGLATTGRYFIDVDDSPKPPKRRISASPALVQRSGAIVLLFYGEEKQNAFARFMDPQILETDCPAKIAGSCENLLVLTDG
ncbi:MAG TPA: 6-phosphogluconolactonase [Spirochaetia bacterium]|nr:6-phosphogluconolactonase [Spirochaetia bacterium]